MRGTADVSIVHPLDPTDLSPGGFDTCIADLLKYSPPHLSIEVLGVSSNPKERPIGRWNRLSVAGRKIDFLGLLAEGQADRVRPLPLSLRFAIAGRFRRVNPRGRIVQFHRFESALAVGSAPDQAVVHFVHNDPSELTGPNTDVRWRWFKPLYFRLLLDVLRGSEAVFTVDPRSGAWFTGRGLKPTHGFHHLRVWADAATFNPDHEIPRADARRALQRAHSLDPSTPLVIYAGRLARQKNLGLLIGAVAKLRAEGQALSVLIVGRGPSKPALERQVAALGLEGVVRFGPTVSRQGVAALYRACDLVACSSHYEAGPRSVVEALACGSPVVTTSVGQAPAILKQHPAAGSLVEAGGTDAFAEAIAIELGRPLDRERERACSRAVGEYRPEVVLRTVYDLYERLL